MSEGENDQYNTDTGDIPKAADSEYNKDSTESEPINAAEETADSRRTIGDTNTSETNLTVNSTEIAENTESAGNGETSENSENSDNSENTENTENTGEASEETESAATEQEIPPQYKPPHVRKPLTEEEEARINKYKKFKKVNGETYKRVNTFLRKHTYITAREWAIARLLRGRRRRNASSDIRLRYRSRMRIPCMASRVFRGFSGFLQVRGLSGFEPRTPPACTWQYRSLSPQMRCRFRPRQRNSSFPRRRRHSRTR